MMCVLTENVRRMLTSTVDLRGADFKGAPLNMAIFSGADLRGPDLREAAGFSAEEEINEENNCHKEKSEV